MLTLEENMRQKQIRWIDAVLELKQWNRTEFARRAGVDPSTLSKFLNDPQKTQTLNANTVSRLERVSPLKAYDVQAAPRLGGLAENEAHAYEPPSSPDDVATAVAAIKARYNVADAWILSSRALEIFGYFPGDVLVVDRNAQAVAGDIVCAQVYDGRGAAETIFRLMDTPYLIASSLDRTLAKPLLIDSDRVGVRGVVISSIRPRAVRKPA